MPPRLTRRSFSAILAAAPALLPRKAAAVEIPSEWGDLWQPVLPGRERHPFLYYDDSDRDRMLARISTEPWRSWWALVQGTSVRSNAPFRWWLTGDEAAARYARWDLMYTPIYRQQPQGYLEPSSHYLADYVAAYDLLASWAGLSPDDHSLIRDRIAAEADYYFGILSGGPRGGANYGNQRTLGASAMGIAALALCEYGGSANGPSEWLSRALYEIRRDENFRFFREDGLFVEGTGYVNYMDLQFVPFTIAYERAGGKYLFEEPRLRESLIFASCQMLAGGDEIPWGTCELWDGIPAFAALCNERYGRDMGPLFAWTFARDMQPHPLHRHIAIAQYDDAVPGDMPAAARVFPASQTAVFRDDWGHDCVSAWFAGKDAGWWSRNIYSTYSHGDSGSFMLAMADEILAADSGYDHWVSKDYYGAEFHNVLLIDGQGPTSYTAGEMSDVETEGPVRHATVTSEYQGSTVRRTFALVRGRYAVVADHVLTDTDHDYAWQLHSTCPPDSSPPTVAGERDVTWPGLASRNWIRLVPGRTQLTTVMPPFVSLSLAPGRWRPRSALHEFTNQVAAGTWRAAETVALFTLIPNLQETPELFWQRGDGQGVFIAGPGWTDTVTIEEGALRITGDDGAVDFSFPL